MFVNSDSVLYLCKLHGPEDARRKWNDRGSTLKMCYTFRELQRLGGDPIDFEWKIFSGAKALDILHKFQADLQGKNITPEKISDRIMFMSMFNDIELERKDNEYSCALTSRQIKEYASNCKDGHWAILEPEKKASGIKVMQSNMVANEIFVRHKWWKFSRIPEIRCSRELARWAVELSRREILETTIHLNGEYGNINLLYTTVHASNQLCIHGADPKWCGNKPRTNSGETNQSRPESARKTPREIQIKQEDLKSLVVIPRLPQASRNRMLQNLKSFNSMPFMSRIEYLRTTSKSFHPVEKKKS